MSSTSVSKRKTSRCSFPFPALNILSSHAAHCYMKCEAYEYCQLDEIRTIKLKRVEFGEGFGGVRSSNVCGLRLPSNFPSSILIIISLLTRHSDIFCQTHHHPLRLERFSQSKHPCQLSIIMSAKANVVLFISFLTSVLAFQSGSLQSTKVAPGRTASELYAWSLPIDTKAAFGTWYTELHPTFRQTTYEEYVLYLDYSISKCVRRLFRFTNEDDAYVTKLQSSF